MNKENKNKIIIQTKRKNEESKRLNSNEEDIVTLKSDNVISNVECVFDTVDLEPSYYSTADGSSNFSNKGSVSTDSISIISDSQRTMSPMLPDGSTSTLSNNVVDSVLTNDSGVCQWCRRYEYKERGYVIDIKTNYGHLEPCCFYDVCIGESICNEKSQLQTAGVDWGMYGRDILFRVSDECQTLLYEISVGGDLLCKAISVGYHHNTISNKQVHAYNGNINIPLLMTIIANLIVEQHIYSILIATAKGKSTIYLTDTRRRFTTYEKFESMSYKTSRFREYSGAIYYPNKILQASLADKYFYAASKIVSFVDGDYIINVSNLIDKKVQFAWYTQDNYPDYLNNAYTKHSSRVNIAKIYDDVGKDALARAKYLSETLKVRVYITNAAGYFSNAKHLVADDNKIPYAYAYGHVYAVSTFGQSVKNDKDISLVCMSIKGISEKRCNTDPEDVLLGTDLHHDAMGWYYCPSSLLDKVLSNTEVEQSDNTKDGKVSSDFDMSQTEIDAVRIFNVSTADIEIDGTLDGAVTEQNKIYQDLSINLDPLVEDAEEVTEKITKDKIEDNDQKEAKNNNQELEYFEAVLAVPNMTHATDDIDLRLLLEDINYLLVDNNDGTDEHQKDDGQITYKIKNDNITLPGHMCNTTHYKRMHHRSFDFDCLPITEEIKYSVMFGEYLDYDENGIPSEGNAWKYLVKKPPGKIAMTVKPYTNASFMSKSYIDLVTLQAEIENLNSTGRVHNYDDYKKIKIIHDRRERIQNASNELWRMLGINDINDYNMLLVDERHKTPVVALNKAIEMHKKQMQQVAVLQTTEVTTSKDTTIAYASTTEIIDHKSDTTTVRTNTIGRPSKKVVFTTQFTHIEKDIPETTTISALSSGTTLSSFLIEAVQATTHWIGAGLSGRYKERKTTFGRNVSIEDYVRRMSRDTTKLCARLVSIGGDMMVKKKRSAPNEKFFDNMQKCKSALESGSDIDQNIIDNINILTGVSVFSVKRGSVYVKLPPVRFTQYDESVNVLNHMFKDMLRSLIYVAQVNRDATLMKKKNRMAKRSTLQNHGGTLTNEPIEMKNMGKVSALANTIFYRGLRWVSFTLDNEPILLSNIPELSMDSDVDAKNIDIIRDKFERENYEMIMSETRMETTGSIYDAMTSTAWYDIRQVKFIMIGEHIDLYNIEQQLQDLYPGLAYFEMFNAIMLNSYMQFISLYCNVYEVPIMGTTLGTASEDEMMSQLSHMSYVEQSKFFVMMRQKRKKIPVCLVVKPTREKETVEHIHRTTGMRPRISGDYNTWSSYSPLVISTDPSIVSVCKFSIFHEMTETEFDIAVQLTGFDSDLRRKKYMWYARAASVTMLTPNFYSMQTAMLQYRNMIDTQLYGVLGLSN